MTAHADRGRARLPMAAVAGAAIVVVVVVDEDGVAGPRGP
jgi:hypothetical protein